MGAGSVQFASWALTRRRAGHGHTHPLPTPSATPYATPCPRSDLGCHINGFIATVAQTVVVQEGAAPITGKAADVIQAARTAFDAALRLIRPGKKISDVGEIIAGPARSSRGRARGQREGGRRRGEGSGDWGKLESATALAWRGRTFLAGSRLKWQRRVCVWGGGGGGGQVSGGRSTSSHAPMRTAPTQDSCDLCRARPAAASLQKVVEAYGVNLVEGVMSHQMKQFVIDGNKCVLNKPSPEAKVEDQEFSENEVYAIDIVVSTGDGKTKVLDEKDTTIYK